ncbi:hypothetical protein ACJIZ3_013828 [Penstemon smallii]|uniref:GOLD domain-containing protein n=1 Tax=Penstemon smallii TaxID=265156 RepID=A0ABD3RHZ1_9LAMI
MDLKLNYLQSPICLKPINVSDMVAYIVHLCCFLMQVTSPNGNTVHTLKGTSGDKFEFKAPKSGMYKFCFHNPYSTPESVSFHIHTGHIPTEHDLAKDEHLDPINVKIAELREALESVTAEQKYLRARDIRHRHTNEGTRNRVIFYTVGEYCLLALQVGRLQPCLMKLLQNLVIFIKSSFELSLLCYVYNYIIIHFLIAFESRKSLILHHTQNPPYFSLPDALLQNPQKTESVSALKDGILATHFSSVYPGSVVINLSSSGFMAYSSQTKNPSFPRLFAVVDDIFCLFEGHVENVAHLKQQYGLNKTANEVIIVIEAFRTLRDRGPYPPEQVVRDIKGKFAFILYDSASKATFIASDADGSVPFFWGSDAEGHLVISDDGEVVKQGCGKSFAPFPKGCFFTSSGGLRSYEQPASELKAVPRVDSSGEVCGLTFKVDEDTQKEKPGMPRVGSDANWSQHY